MTDNNSVLLEKRGQAFWITINRPEKRNAINADVIAGIRERLPRRARRPRRARDRPHRRRRQGVLRRRRPADPARPSLSTFARPNVDYADLLRLSQNATEPAIARVNGVCMAGGMGLLCMADMAVAADHAVFGLPEVKVGVFPMQVMSLLQNRAAAAVSEWALTGEPFDAHAAQAAGLLNHVVPAAELDAKVEWLIGRLVDKSPTAIRRGKYAMRAIASMSFDQASPIPKARSHCCMTEDAKEGLAAFGEKRKPAWKGK